MEGSAFTAVLASAGCRVDTDRPITIDWGDGTTSTGTTDSSGLDLVGTHAYAEEGNYTGSVTWFPPYWEAHTRTASFSITATDAPLSATPIAVTATEGTAFTGPVATFTDADSAGTTSDYSATISWGDGSVSAGTVSAVSGGFAVTGTHTYSPAGTYQTTVSVADVGGATTVAHGSATVSAIPAGVIAVGPVPVVTGAPAPVTTGAPLVTSPTGVAFSGSVNPDGLPTTVYFEYGLDRRYSTPGASGPMYTDSTPAQGVGSDFLSHAVSAMVAGLVPNAVYHVRVVATNSAGTSFGTDVEFSTAKSPAPGPPTLGHTFDVAPVSGVVLVKISGRFVPLTELRQIANNTVIDARRGTLNLITASGGLGAARDAAAKRKQPTTQSGTFGGAIFNVIQGIKGASRGLATLTLLEGLRGAPSYASCQARKAVDASPRAVSRRTLQLLHASAKGKFRTSGRYSAATVRGTKWTIADRCDGTLTHDITDSVAVNDFVRHKTIVLHAGQSYLARKR
ncbi:MAG: PKD domain-containing protein [Solirubrobacterales bacterium]|nr:PKD domain-containing protein [Solirubrobacterales bacterium]